MQFFFKFIPSRHALFCLILFFTCPLAYAQKVGDRVECSPYGLATQWFPGTIVKQEGADFLVRLDPRAGYSSPEKYIVSKKFIRPGGAAAQPALVPGPIKPLLPGLANPAPPVVTPVGNQTATPAADPPIQQSIQAPPTDGQFKVGDRVRVSRNFLKDEKYWEAAVITKIVPGSGFEVHTDGKSSTSQGDWFIVRPEWIKHAAAAPPNFAEPGPFPINKRPIPTAQKTYPASNCQANEGYYKEMIEDWKRFNFGLDYDQVDVLWDNFQIGGTTTVFDPYNQAQFSNARDVTAHYRVRAIRRYTQGGRNFVKTVVYQYKQHVYFYVDKRGNCVYQTKDGSMGELIYDQTKEVAMREFERIQKFVYERPQWLHSACERSTSRS